MVLSKSGGWRKIIFDSIKSQVGTLVSLPSAIKQTLDLAQKGQLQVNNPNEIKALEKINHSIRLLAFTFLSIGAFTLSYLYQEQDFKSYFMWGGILFLALVLKKIIKI